MNDRSKDISGKCAYGHSFDEHIDEFKDLGIETPSQYKEHIKNVLESRETECFSAYSTKQTWRLKASMTHKRDDKSPLAIVPKIHIVPKIAFR